MLRIDQLASLIEIHISYRLKHNNCIFNPNYFLGIDNLAIDSKQPSLFVLHVALADIDDPSIGIEFLLIGHFLIAKAIILIVVSEHKGEVLECILELLSFVLMRMDGNYITL